MSDADATIVDLDHPDRGGCAPADVTARLQDGRGDVTVTRRTDGDCAVSYRIDSTATRRDDAPASPRVVRELSDWPSLRSGNVLLDGLYALALEEVRQNSVDAISDGSFNGGQPIDCAPGGCFETGALWHYVWTRDIAYATDLGLASLDPVRARNSLEYKLSARRSGGGVEVMQDTGTGGGYPVSTDRVVWALGARAVLAQLGDDEAQAFGTRALDALLNTLTRDREVVFDSSTGLYFGEQSFLDWREQSYPGWVKGDPTHIATSRSLSTNVAHLRAMEFAVELAEFLGRSDEAADWVIAAAALRAAINDVLWLGDRGQFSSFLVSQLDLAPSPQLDLLGSSLAILSGVATAEQAQSVLAGYPHVGVGAPVIFPQQQLTPIYHNRAEWPFVSAYWLRAAAASGNDLVATRTMESLVRGAALNLSNMENWEIASGAPWVEDGEYSGPVVNSQRQLWSVAGFVSMIQSTLFGLHADLTPDPVLRVAPKITGAIRAAYLGDSSTLTLTDYRYRGMKMTVVIELPDDAADGFYGVAEVTLDGMTTAATIPATELREGSVITIRLAAPQAASSSRMTLVDDADWKQVFAPRPPVIDTVGDDAGQLRVTFSTADTEPVTWTIYRDGRPVASELTATSWLDPDSDSASPRSPCYVVESCFQGAENCSQHSQSVCWWGAGGERVQTIAASALQNVGGVLSDEHGRQHWSVWGDAGHRLTASGVRPAATGAQLIQLGYGNGAGSTTTGVTCGVKRVVVTDEADDTVVASGYVAMPQLGAWDVWGLSSMVHAQMSTDRTYRIDVLDGEFAYNMSAFEHFAAYGGEGGAQAFNRVNVAELRVLSR